MTNPEPPGAGTTPAPGQIGFAFQPVQGPDHKPWILTLVIAPPLQMQFALPLDTIPDFIDNLNQATDQARRAALGLVIPNNGTPIPNIKGH